jgi:predicted RNA-binding protein with TRAM domain
MGYRNRNSGFNKYDFKAPVEVGKVYESDIIEMSRRGDAGVAKIQGFVIFVSNAKPGDHVKFEITKVGRRYATAEVIKEGTDEEEKEE